MIHFGGCDRNTEKETGALVLANVARRMGVNPERAHENAYRKFMRRSRYVEKKPAKSNSSPDKSSLGEMEQL